MHRNFIFLLFLNVPIFAQTGPGGIGDNTNNIIWLSADSGVYNDAGVTLAANNNSVQEWHDRSGNNNHATETTSGNQPTYLTNLVNGLPTIRFDGSLDRLLSSGVTATNQLSLWVVGQYASLGSPNPGLIHGAPLGSAFSTSTTSKSVGMWVSSSTNQVWGRGVQSNLTIRSIPQVTTLSSNTYYGILNHFDGTNIQQFVNSTAAGSISYDGTLASWSDFGIGRQANESWNGDIAEVIVFNFAINTAQRIIVDNYLAAKYDFSLTSNDVYDMDDSGNGDYDFEVAGIGRVDASNIHNDAQGSSIVRISKSSFGGLGNDEFLIWGHDNGPLTSVGYTDVPSGLMTRLGRSWRVAEKNTSGSSINVGRVYIDFDLSGLSVTSAADLRLLIDSDGDGDFSDAATYTVETDLGGDVYRFNISGGQLRDSRTFTVATTSTALPVELVSFDVTLMDDAVTVKWSTASETNNDFFTVQKSADAQEFEDILNIPGAGNSHNTLFYEAVDTQPLGGRSFYRLKQTDFDGTASYSEIKSILYQVADQHFSVYPIPTTSNFEISSRADEAGTTEVTMIDAQGKIYTRFKLTFKAGVQKHPISLSALAPGTYYLKFHGKSNTTIPIIIEK
ncbi:MAG: hypothetical protein DHS20C17_31670 [Cyclobacteriaceae bacterium]|nr:MAG: hypothetical protein DHS20C17_31670 [Cyclobacteriaceae bacterium]